MTFCGDSGGIKQTLTRPVLGSDYRQRNLPQAFSWRLWQLVDPVRAVCQGGGAETRTADPADLTLTEAIAVCKRRSSTNISCRHPAEQETLLTILIEDEISFPFDFRGKKNKFSAARKDSLSRVSSVRWRNKVYRVYGAVTSAGFM